jgi:peptidoglycan/xylan/chitin deacetylase (PgdA/CDA1 family)
VTMLKQLAFGAYVYSGYPRLRDTVQALAGRPRVVVLCYHRIGGQGVLSKTLEQFASDLEYLKRSYTCMSLWEFSERLRNGRLRSRPAAVVTFDDGYRDNFMNAVPVLLHYKIPASFFVSTGFMGVNRSFPHDEAVTDEQAIKRYGPNASFEKLRWDELREMQTKGFEIGSHTVNHADFSRVDPNTLQVEINDSLQQLQRELGERPRPFAFPWGTPAQVTKQALQILRGSGYYAALTMFPGSNTYGQDVFQVKRIDAGNGNLTNLAFSARIAGFNLNRS